MPFADQQLVCATCNGGFTFTADEQSAFEQRGFRPPRNCGPCRDARRNERGARGGRGGRGGRDARDDRAVGRAQRPDSAAAVAPAPRRPRAPGFAPASFDDPNGYRAPAAMGAMPRRWEDSQGPAGMQATWSAPASSTAPASSLSSSSSVTGEDEPEDDSQSVMLARAASRPSRGAAGTGGFDLPYGRRVDRAGTDPNAYRSPGFSGASKNDRGASGAGPARAWHDATCASCGVEASVPFVPSAARPAYCRACYRNRTAR